jgi:DNA helicase-2/ATP-dependent DNA helicase PcrA
MQNQMTNGQFAILYRTNAQSRSMEDALRKETYRTAFMEVYLFHQRKDVLYLRLVLIQRRGGTNACINYPARGIGNTTIN